MNILELLKFKGLNVDEKIKMIRHQQQNDDLYDIYRRNPNDFEIYQSFQGKPVLNCKYLVSFIGRPHGHAMFVGVYRVDDVKPISEVTIPADYPYPGLIPEAGYWYELVKCDGYNDLIDRVVIAWGPSERSWHQWLTEKKEKEVVEILPSGSVEHFPGFLKLTMDFYGLKKMIENPIPNREWHQLLKSVAGVYLILDTATGMQYVGSAYGIDGILGRWRSYAETGGHGGNVRLKQLVESNDDYPGKFKFSILHTLPVSITKNEAIEWENLFKEKLGTRASGLNIN